MARRLTEDTINQELMRLGLPNTTMIKAPSVVVSGGRSSLDKVLVAGICSAIATLLLFVCLLLLLEEAERPSAGRNAARRWKCEPCSGRNSLGASDARRRRGGAGGGGGSGRQWGGRVGARVATLCPQRTSRRRLQRVIQ